jgi:hypothetical protein
MSIIDALFLGSAFLAGGAVGVFAMVLLFTGGVRPR